jgi:hypothetical protein
VGLRSKVHKLEQDMQKDLGYFTLEDGSKFFFDANDSFGLLFDHASSCLKADARGEPRPDPPEILLAVTKARDREGVINRLFPLPSKFCGCDLEILAERGELVPHRFVTPSDSQEEEEDEE